MTYNVFSGTLNLTPPTPPVYQGHRCKMVGYKFRISRSGTSLCLRRVKHADILLLLELLYRVCVGKRIHSILLLEVGYIVSFSFSTFPPSGVRFSSVETSMIDLKPQHKVDSGPSSNRNIFWKSEPGFRSRRSLFERKRGTPIHYGNDVVSLQQQRGNVHYRNRRANRRNVLRRNRTGLRSSMTSSHHTKIERKMGNRNPRKFRLETLHT